MTSAISELVRVLKKVERHQRWAERLPPNNIVKVTDIYTIDSGTITLTGYDQIRLVRIETEGAAATDNLDKIDGGVAGDIIICRAYDTTHTVVLTDNTENLRLAGDCTLDASTDTITLIYRDTVWIEIARSNND